VSSAEKGTHSRGGGSSRVRRASSLGEAVKQKDVYGLEGGMNLRVGVEGKRRGSRVDVRYKRGIRVKQQNKSYDDRKWGCGVYSSGGDSE